MNADPPWARRVAALGPASASLASAPAPARAALRDCGILAAVLVGGGILVLLGLFAETAQSMVHTWSTSSTFGHGYLILPISAYLIWRKRAALARTMPRASVLGLAVTAAAAFVWLLGELAGTLVIRQVAFVVMVQGLLLSVLGVEVVRTIAFPVAYLLFAVPIGTFLVQPLQDFTAQFLVVLLRQTGVPVYLDGIFLQIPEAAFEVAEACAGLRFLISSIALGVIFAHLFYRQLWRRLAFVGLAVVVPIVANGVRAYGIVMIAHLGDQRTAVATDHVTFGLVFLSVVFLCLFALGMTFRERGPRAPSAAAAPPPRRAAAMASRPALLLAAAATALLPPGLASAYASYIEHRPADVRELVLTPPDLGPHWRAVAQSGGTWGPTFVGSDAELFQTYAAGERRVDLYIAYYARQRQGAEVVHFQNRPTGQGTWERAASGRTETALAGTPLTVRYDRLVSRSGRRMVWTWYWVDGRFTSSPYIAKLLEVRAELLGGVRAAAAIVVAADYEEQAEEANRLLGDFLAQAGGLRAMLEASAP